MYMKEMEKEQPRWTTHPFVSKVQGARKTVSFSISGRHTSPVPALRVKQIYFL